MMTGPESVTCMENVLNQVTDSPWRDKQGIADYYRVSIRTINEWMRRKVIPFQKVDRTVRFNIHHCDTALMLFQVKSTLVKV
jgi:hypothetical protein